MCYTVVVATATCEFNHPVVSKKATGQKLCWRQCRAKSSDCSVQHESDPKNTKWDICEKTGHLDRKAHVVIIDDDAMPVANRWECPVCRSLGGAPEIREVQESIDRTEEWLRGIPNTLEELEEEQRFAPSEAEAIDLAERVHAVRMLRGLREEQLMVHRRNLQELRRRYIAIGRLDVVEAALVAARRQAPKPSVYMGSQDCKWEQDHPVRQRACDWPLEFMPDKDLEAYREKGEPLTIPLCTE